MSSRGRYRARCFVVFIAKVAMPRSRHQLSMCNIEATLYHATRATNVFPVIVLFSSLKSPRLSTAAAAAATVTPAAQSDVTKTHSSMMANWLILPLLLLFVGCLSSIGLFLSRRQQKYRDQMHKQHDYYYFFQTLSLRYLRPQRDRKSPLSACSMV